MVMENKLEYRMYFLVMYNLSGIQKGIQSGHAITEYALKYFDNLDFQDWANDNKTFIVLDGGTSNTGVNYGSMERNQQLLLLNNINHAIFREPDLNDATSAIAFLVDERAYDYKKYPYPTCASPTGHGVPMTVLDDYIPSDINEWESIVKKRHFDWVKSIGGDKNVFLRSFLKDFKLASN
jgi:hypothetical protein